MGDGRHFIVYEGATPHSTVWLVKASSLRDALTQYALDQFAGAHLGPEGEVVVDDVWGGEIHYAHPLEAIEAEAKARAEWQIREVNAHHWEAPLAEVFCGEDRYSIKEYVDICRPLMSQHDQKLGTKTFVWYLNSGPLVTFFRKRRIKATSPISIIDRYLIPWKTWPKSKKWTGTYDDIEKDLLIAQPDPALS